MRYWNRSLISATEKQPSIGDTSGIYDLMSQSIFKNASKWTAAIVTSGLVLNLDAGDSSSYPGSGTTWSDLSGSNNDATLTNGPTFDSANGGSIVLDGTNDFIQMATNSNLTFAGDFTYETWVQTDVQNTSNHIWGPLSNGQTMQFNNNQIIYYSSGTGSQSFGGLANATWGHFVLTKSSGTLVGYLNGSQAWTNSPASSAHDFSGIKVGQRSNNSLYWDGKMSIIRIYEDKGLTADEVLGNYNALKGRYGL